MIYIILRQYGGLDVYDFIQYTILGFNNNNNNFRQIIFRQLLDSLNQWYKLKILYEGKIVDMF